MIRKQRRYFIGDQYQVFRWMEIIVHNQLESLHRVTTGKIEKKNQEKLSSSLKTCLSFSLEKSFAIQLSLPSCFCVAAEQVGRGQPVPGRDTTAFMFLYVCERRYSSHVFSASMRRRKFECSLRANTSIPIFRSTLHDHRAYEILNMDSAERARGRGRASLFPLRSFLAPFASSSLSSACF